MIRHQSKPADDMALVRYQASMEAFLYSLAGLAITGLAFVAYNHPRAYAKAFPYLLGLTVTVMAVLAAYDVGLTTALETLTHFIASERMEAATAWIRAKAVPPVWLAVVGSSISVFLIGLNFLDGIKDSDRNDK